MTQSCSVEDGFVLNMGRVQDAKMLKEVMKVVEQEAEETKKEEASTSIPKPSFLANLVAIQQLKNMPECPVPRKKKAKKTVRFILSTVSKRKLHMEEEEGEEVGMLSLKRVRPMGRKEFHEPSSSRSCRLPFCIRAMLTFENWFKVYRNG